MLKKYFSKKYILIISLLLVFCLSCSTAAIEKNTTEAEDTNVSPISPLRLFDSEDADNSDTTWWGIEIKKYTEEEDEKDDDEAQIRKEEQERKSEPTASPQEQIQHTEQYQEQIKQEQQERYRKITIEKPAQGEEVKSVIHIKGEASNIDKIELYLKQGISHRLFIGEARIKNNNWGLQWDSRTTPNGEYYIIARDKESDYEIERPVRVFINNPVAKPKTTSLIAKRVEKFNQTVTDIDDSNKKVNQEAEKLTKPEKSESEKELGKEILETIERVEETAGKIEKETQEISQRETITKEINEIVQIKNTEGEAKALEYANGLVDQHKEDKQNLIEEIRNTAERVEALHNRVRQETQISEEVKREELVQETEKIITQINETIKLLEKTQFENFKPNEDVSLDSDGDGLSDLIEAVYGTDITDPDSDDDGFLDSIEVQYAYDPLDPSRTSKVVYEEPRTAGEVKADIYRIVEVNNEKVTDVITEMERERPIFKGIALPNSFVTLYIYSDLPIVVTTQADEDGQWSYVLSKALDTGEHEIYVAITDNSGKIVAKSEPRSFFILEARAVAPETYFASPEYSRAVEAEAATKNLIMPYAYITFAVIFIALIIALLFIAKKGKSMSDKIIRRDYK